MGLLNRLFGSTESIASDAKYDEEVIFSIWNDYISTIGEKEQIIEQLPSLFGEKKNHLRKFKQLLNLELADISKADKREQDIISNLLSLEHAKKIKRVHRLEDCLRYVEKKHEYIYELLRHLYSILISESRLADEIAAVKELKKFRKLIVRLKSEFLVEMKIVEKRAGINDFYGILTALARREYIVRTMDSKEKKLLNKIQKGVGKIFSNEIKEGITYEWTIAVFNAVQDLVMDYDAIMAAGYEPHENVDFEFVNRQEFVVLARETIQNIRQRNVSEQMINVFVHLFREWYNYERD